MVSNKNILVGAMMLLSSQAAMAQSNDSIDVADSIEVVNDVKTDTIIYQEPSLITTKIHAMVRTYGDSIALRWVPEDFVSWKYLCQTGVNVLRTETDAKEFSIDTLAYALKPLSEEAFRAKYAANDSNALVAQGVLYGKGRLGPNQTTGKPGSIEASMEYNNEQDMSFAFAMLVADWRPDLARDMAVGFLDRTAKPGKSYDYYIQPTKWETDGRLIFEPGVVEGVVNETYTPVLFNPRMVDSISSPRRHVLGWWDDKYSTYEIFRHAISDADGNKIDSEWEHLNQKPYLSVIELPEGDSYKAFGDSVPSFGVYEYRVAAHDAFGGLVPSVEPFKVNVYDNEPPFGPQLKRMVVEYPDGDPTGRTLVHFVWEKDSIEPDLDGYVINFYNQKNTGGTWMGLNDKLIPPTDTIYTTDMTGYREGMVYISAYDKSGNEGRSLTQFLHLRDYKAPEPPDSLTALVIVPQTLQFIDIDTKYAYVILRWKPNPEDDDIMHYDVAFANDTTHSFQRLNELAIHERSFIDSLALDVNQKYIYYKVRATDYTGNEGDWSPWIQVMRPHVTPPTQPHLERSSHNDTEGMHMEWIVGTDADMDYHLAYRGLSEDGPWELIGRYDHDSLTTKNHTIVIDDNPPYDRDRRYYYYVESFNSSPFSAKSLAVSWFHPGPKVYKVNIELAGTYDERTKQTKLAWTTGKLPFDAPYYYCIARKGPENDKLEFLLSVAPDELEYTDKLLNKGEEAQYQVMIQWRDGRQSTPSNTVTVRRAE